MDAWHAALVGLEEDLGPKPKPKHDRTSAAVVGKDVTATGHFVARQPGVISGTECVEAVWKILGHAEVKILKPDGEHVNEGDVVATVTGSARSILAGERTALNLLSHLSGIATLTRRFVDLANGSAIVDTRKTLPGLRELQKQAVEAGGGVNHRMGLTDAILIKDNHLTIADSISEAVGRSLETGLWVQVECETPDQVTEAVKAGAHSVLIDNRTPEELAGMVAAAQALNPDIIVEASGGVNLETVAAIAATEVDRISVGALTHSASALDIGLDFEVA